MPSNLPTLLGHAYETIKSKSQLGMCQLKKKILQLSSYDSKFNPFLSSSFGHNQSWTALGPLVCLSSANLMRLLQMLLLVGDDGLLKGLEALDHWCVHLQKGNIYLCDTTQ